MRRFIGDDRPDLTEIFADVLNLLSDAKEKFQIPFELPGDDGFSACVGRIHVPIVTGADEVMDLHGRTLPVTIQATVALFQTVGVPGNFIMKETRTVVLEIDAFGSGVGGLGVFRGC